MWHRCELVSFCHPTVSVFHASKTFAFSISQAYPEVPRYIFSTRYLGTYSCAEYYDRGLHGLIPAYLCGPLQDYAEEHCGCIGYNPDCILDPSKCHDTQPSAVQPGYYNDAVESSPEPANAFGLILGVCGAVVGAGVALAYLKSAKESSPEYNANAAEIEGVVAGEPQMV